MMEQDQLRLAQQGDTDAVAWIVETYQKPVYGLCYRKLGSAVEAEDAAQEALVKAVMNLHSFDLTRPFKPWLLRIAANECVDRLRRRHPTVSLDGMGEDGAWEWQAGQSPNPESEVVQEERLEQVRALLGTLAPIDRTVITLFYWEGLSYNEIAEMTDLSVSAIKSRLFRARRIMAQQLVEEGTYAGNPVM